jgi:short-subunit dehydrogenase
VIATLTGALPGMVARRQGHLVGISSVAKYRGLPNTAAYCASKAFVSVFLESLRIDLHHAGVSVTEVRPGYVDTPLIESLKTKPFLVDANDAAKTIATAIARKRKILVFPLPIAAAGRLLERMPSAIYEPMVRRVYKG